jgi:DHA1 family inner membrane transport protein
VTEAPVLATGVGITIPTAGRIVSAYALGVVVGAPLIATLAARMTRTSVLIWLMVAFAAGNIASSMAAGALGAYLGSIVLEAGLGYEWPSRVGVLLALSGVSVAAVSVLVGRREGRAA